MNEWRLGEGIIAAEQFDAPTRFDGQGAFDRVLIGTSLTAASDQVVRSSLAVAEALGSQVYLLHVTPLEPLTFGFEGLFGESVVRSLKSERESDLADQIRHSGIQKRQIVSAEVVAGAAHQALADAASSFAADLIIVGATEGHGSSGRRLGSTTDRLIRSAHCPVLILRNEMRLPPRRVVAPADFSSTSALALGQAVRFLGQMAADNTTTIESVFVLPELTRQLATKPSLRQIERTAKEELLRFTFEHTSGWNGTIEARVRIGDARSQVQIELEEPQIDLAVVGSHGHQRMHRGLIGSVAEQIARHARCSVLFVPDGQDSSDPAAATAHPPRTSTKLPVP